VHATLALSLLLIGSCQTLSTAPESKSEVLVLGMIHQGHLNSETFGIEVVQDIVRDFNPDYILVEIPPERMHVALEGFLRTGKLTEPRARLFPEYRDAIFPLLLEEDFELIGCAGWTRAMADDRRVKLTAWQTSRPLQSAEVDAAMELASAKQAAEGLENLRGIHTARYDALVKEGMEPYDRYFNHDLGLGGWTNINAAHYANIARALDAHQGEGKRFLITFGAWHKYWFLEQLRQRNDVIVLELER
jgi:hypothetical protein